MNDEFEKQLKRELEQNGASDTEVRELLKFASKLSHTPKLERPYVFKKQKFRKIFEQKRQRSLFRASEDQGTTGHAHGNLFSWPKFFVPAFAAFLLLLVLGGGVVIASQKSLPGEPLYPIKRASENVKAIIEPESKQELIIKRGEEVKEIVENKEDPQQLRDSLDELRREARKNRKDSRLEESLERLEEAKDNSSDDEKDEIERALEEIRREREDDDNREDEERQEDKVKGENSGKEKDSNSDDD